MKKIHDEEKLNNNGKNFINDESSLSLDQELKASKGGRFASAWRWVKDTNANIYKWFVKHPLFTYSIKRIIYGLITLLAAIIIIFLITRAITDDIQYLPDGVGKMNLSKEEIRALQIERMKAYGVYGSLGTQLGNYLRDLFPLIPKQVPATWSVDPITHQAVMTTKTVWLYLGVVTNSLIAQPGTGVLELFNDSVPYTFVYALIAVAISFLIAIPLGIESARFKGKWADRIINGIAIVLTAIPAMIIVVGIYLIANGGFETSGMFASGNFWSKFWPAVTLILVIAPPQIIMTRRYVADEMTNEYAKFAASQGLSERFIYFNYIFRNAAARILKAVPLELVIAMFGSTILIEKQWGIPGIGRSIVAAVSGQKDSFVIMGFVSFAAFIQIFGTLISDLLVVWLDPKASLNQRK